MTPETSPTADRNEPGPQGRWSRVRQHQRLIVLASLLALSVVVIAGRYFSSRESTDNARIEGPVHPVSARVGGFVVELFVDLHQSVVEGQPLFRLDPRDYQIALELANAELEVARAAARVAEQEVPIAFATADGERDGALAGERNARSGVQLATQAARAAEADFAADEARLRQARARQERTARDLTRVQSLVAKQQISEQELDTVSSEAKSARASVDALEAAVRAARESVAIARQRIEAARAELDQSRAELRQADTAGERKGASTAAAEAARARVDLAEATLDRARLDLEYTTVLAPATGWVGRKSVELGQVVAPGQPVLAVVGEEVWIEANFKETQIRRMRVGQRAVVKVDSDPWRRLAATVVSIAPATGSRFSLLPPENATGNFVKVVQRVPVRIRLDEPAAADIALRPGMSVVVTVRLRDRADSDRADSGKASTPGGPR